MLSDDLGQISKCTHYCSIDQNNSTLRLRIEAIALMNRGYTGETLQRIQRECHYVHMRAMCDVTIFPYIIALCFYWDYRRKVNCKSAKNLPIPPQNLARGPIIITNTRGFRYNQPEPW